MGHGAFVGIGPFANARQLLGTFEGSNSAGSSTGSVVASSTLVFRADGTYGDSRMGTASVRTPQSTTDASSSKATAGRWALAGWLLTLTDGKGKTVQGLAFPTETDDQTGQVTRFCFNNVGYKRQ